MFRSKIQAEGGVATSNRGQPVKGGCAAPLLLLLTSIFAAEAPFAEAALRTATCNNTNSDSATINSTIASSVVGDEIVIDGPCRLIATIKLLGDRSYRGQSRTGTVLRQGNGANLVALLASDSFLDNTTFTGDPVAVRQFTLDGNKANNSAATEGLVLRSWQSVVEDLYVTGMGGSGIKVTNLSANGTALTNTQVNGRIVGNFIEDSDAHGVFIEDTGNSVTDWNLLDNWVAGVGENGIHVDNAAGWTIERNHIYGVPKTAIFAHRTYGTSISDNYIEDFGGGGAGTWYGIEATVQGDAATTITGNRVFEFGGESNTGSTYRYIGISNVNYGTGVASVTGNAVRGAGTPRGTGFHFRKGGGAGLIVASTGNVVNSVNRPRSTGAGVTVTAGQ